MRVITFPAIMLFALNGYATPPLIGGLDNATREDLEAEYRKLDLDLGWFMYEHARVSVALLNLLNGRDKEESFSSDGPNTSRYSSEIRYNQRTGCYTIRAAASEDYMHTEIRLQGNYCRNGDMHWRSNDQMLIVIHM